jgi:hypothetical protein
LALGFVQSKTDKCLFLHKDCILVVYIDDCLTFAEQDHTIDTLIQALSKSFLLQDEGDVNAFLGVQITRDPEHKTITLTQPSLIQQIIQDVGITNMSNGKDTPVDAILYADTTGPARQEKWNYRSVIGRLNYLANNTRHDISMAVHQCARFCTNPKAVHDLAIKRIARYLLPTADKGIILTPSTDMALKMYMDADFAGRWHKKYAELRDNVLSRTGYVILFCICLVVWGSKLQSEIALSTTESEYIALSTSLRELLPLRCILSDINNLSFISCAPKSPKGRKHDNSLPPSKIFEDNAACIVLATTDTQLKPRTKHISLKFHHFLDYVHNGTLQILKIATNENMADIFTKPLQYLRKLLMGW